MSERRNLPPGVKRKVLASGAVRYEVRVDVHNPRGGEQPEREQVRKRFKTKAEALEFYNGVQSERARGTFVSPSTMTVEQAVDAWLAGQRIRPKTRSAYITALRPVVDALGSKKVQAVTKGDLEKVRGALEDGTSEMGTWNAPTKLTGKKVRAKWAPTNINVTLRLVTTIFKDLMQQGVLVRNVAELVKRLKTAKPPVVVLTDKQTNTLLSATADDRLGVAWRLATCGMRRGEICALKWDAVDFDAGVVRITENRVAVDGGSVTGAPKTKAAIRDMPMLPEVKAALKREKKRQAEERLRAANLYVGQGYVVCDELGRGLHPDTLTHKWADALADSGLPHVRLHDARHGFASLAHAAGVPLADIAAWLGHEDGTFTLRTYTHSTDTGLANTAATMGGVLGGVNSGRRKKVTQK
ncbi:MAG: site-specific integrase [Mycobacterium sp.]|nr:site-specific integrase [Mycobacterium sp.]